MTTVNYDSRGKRVATRKTRSGKFSMVGAQLFILAMAITAFSIVLGSM